MTHAMDLSVNDPWLLMKPPMEFPTSFGVCLTTLVRSPLVPLFLSPLLLVFPARISMCTLVVCAYLSARNLIHWWSSLEITVNSVQFKAPVGSAFPKRARQSHAPADSVRDAGEFLSPRESDNENTPQNRPPNQPEWAPFAPSMPYGVPDNGGKPCWTWCDASVFDVRNLGYKASRDKVPSDVALFDTVGMDLIKDYRRLDNLMSKLPEKLDLPRPHDGRPWDPSWGVPRVICVNCQCPYQCGNLFGAHPEDDGGFSCVSYFSISAQTCDLLASGHVSPAVRLLQRLVEEGSSTKEGISFKVIGRIEDLDKHEVPQSFHGFNNKPVLLTKTAKVITTGLPEVLEIDFDVRLWVYVARSTLYRFNHRLREADIEIGFLIEGKTDDELPEQVLGCFTLINFDIMVAQRVSLM